MWWATPTVTAEPECRATPEGGPTVDENGPEDEPRPRGALLLILIYLAVLAGFWLNTYLRIWRS
jgi:hypothetical protein